MSEHPRVESFLRAFDTASARMPIARRRALRAEIAAHLREVVQPDATDEQARLALLEFGTPDEIVGQEGVSAPVHARRGWAIAAIAAGVVAAVIVVAVVTRPSPPDASVPVAAVEHDSVVSAHPNGAERETEGEAFGEYAYEASLLPALPAGAEWPTGVQAGLSEGLSPDGSGVMEGTGGGAWAARYTWLCAWEWEYLNATTREDAERQAAAVEAFEFWTASDFWAEVDPEGSWGESMRESLEEKSLRSFKGYFAQNCMQAGILGVQYSY